MQKVLVIAPHLDDEVLGCGGTICKLLKEDYEVRVVFIANRVYNHIFDPEKMEIELSHMKDAKNVLGYQEYQYLGLPDEKLDQHFHEILVQLEDYVYDFKPDIVFSPFYQDNNQDHRAIAEAVRVVLRPASATFIKRWFFYETPSSTEQSPALSTMFFQPNYYYDISNEIDTKLSALTCYETEARKYPHPRSPEAVKCVASKRGIEVGFDYAEAFMLIRARDK